MTNADSRARTAQISIRAATEADNPALTRIHADVARYYAGLPRGYLEPPPLAPLAGAPEADPFGGDELMLRLVAESDGEVVGALVARLLEPSEEEGADVPTGTRLLIEYLATAPDSRRQGVGTLLVDAAEQWGRAAGAVIAETTAYHGSALAVPFWEDRMGYEERSVNMQKLL